MFVVKVQCFERDLSINVEVANGHCEYCAAAVRFDDGVVFFERPDGQVQRIRVQSLRSGKILSCNQVTPEEARKEINADTKD